MTNEEIAIEQIKKMGAANKKTSVNRQAFIDSLTTNCGLTNWDAKTIVRGLVARGIFHTHTMDKNPQLYYGELDQRDLPKLVNERDPITRRPRWWKNEV